MTYTPIFSTEFLYPYLQNFHLDNVVGINEKRDILKRWQEQLESGKLDLMKEEEIKSRFTTEIFGGVLGFNYQNTGTWLYREEVKTRVDATKPDAALGLFAIRDEQIDNKVRIVIEIKNAQTDLDKPQVRVDTKNSPVEQGFLYATKSSADCQWVVVSNLKTIRFYHARFQGEYQLFELADMLDEQVLSTFLFLFHRERLMNRLVSATEKLYKQRLLLRPSTKKGLHILDELYHCLFRFDDLGFVDPNFIANLYPFNILGDEVRHYESAHLFTLNPAIYQLLTHIKIENYQITINEILTKELADCAVTKPEYKLNYVFKKLNRCLILSISAIKDIEEVRKANRDAFGFNLRICFNFDAHEGLTKSITLIDGSLTDEFPVNLYADFKFKELTKKAKAMEGRPEAKDPGYAYANSILAPNHHKTAYSAYSSAATMLKGSDIHAIGYFLTQYNLKQLGPYLKDYQLEDREQILNHIKAIDLDEVLYQQIDIFIDDDQRRYLLDIRGQRLQLTATQRLERLAAETKRHYTEFKNGTVFSTYPNETYDLNLAYALIYMHFAGNLIVNNNNGPDFKSTGYFIEGLVYSYLSPSDFNSFTVFQLSCALLYLSTDRLKELFDLIDHIAVEPDNQEALIELLVNYLESGYELFHGRAIPNKLLGSYLDDWDFKSLYQGLFSKVFVLLNKLALPEELFRKLSLPIVHHLESVHSMSGYSLRFFEVYLENYGKLFTADQLYELIKICIKEQQSGWFQFRELGRRLAQTLCNHYPDYKITDQDFMRRAIACCAVKSGVISYYSILCYYHIADSSGQRLLLRALEESLDEDFDYRAYREMLADGVISFQHKDYFERWLNGINKIKIHGFVGFEGRNSRYNHFETINFLAMIYKYNIPLSSEQKSSFNELSDFEAWLLDPLNFDYGKFDARWLWECTKQTVFIEGLRKYAIVGEMLGRYLTHYEDAELAKAYFQYWHGGKR